ncbi:hypothetical protein [Dyadobacter sp. 32]|uniref:hypothetical protein n=1 Tax=Dyadobacter sp. 32 TaxID=538966 RepID=UPI0011ED4DE1
MNRRDFIVKSGRGSLVASGLCIVSGWGHSSEPVSYELSGKPCRNFNILANCSLTDPYDQREKFVLSNFAEGETGSIILIDTLTGKGENFVLPVGAGAWGLVNWHNEKLIVGTCTEQAYLHVFDLKTRQWAKPIISEKESYFWQMGLGSDDKVYGGTYPGCALTRYDPATGLFTNLGRVSGNPKNLYSRPVYCGAPGFVFVWYGFDTPGIKVYDIKKETFADFGQPGDTVREVNDRFVCLDNKGKLSFYDAGSLQPIEGEGFDKQLVRRSMKITDSQNVSFIKLRDGRLAGVRGQDYFIVLPPADEEEFNRPVKVELRQIPVQAMPTSIFTLTTDHKGKVWGSCAFGQTIFSFDPKTGKYWNSSSVCNNGGEVYGMVFVEGRLFMSSYVGGDHTVYDPNESWDQLGNVNPKNVGTVAPALIRPEGRSVLGPDGCVWTGWSARYGTYGGGLSSVNPKTLELKSWYDPVPGQQVAGIAADDQYIYFNTNGGASGLAYKEGVKCHFGVWKPGEGLVYDLELDPGDTVNGAIATSGGKVAVAVNKQIRVFDPGLLRFSQSINLSSEKGCNWLLSTGKGKVVAFCGKQLLEVDILNRGQRIICDLPDTVRMATFTSEGEIYFSVRSDLYKIKNY